MEIRTGDRCVIKKYVPYIFTHLFSAAQIHDFNAECTYNLLMICAIQHYTFVRILKSGCEITMTSVCVESIRCMGNLRMHIYLWTLNPNITTIFCLDISKNARSHRVRKASNSRAGRENRWFRFRNLA